MAEEKKRKKRKITDRTHLTYPWKPLQENKQRYYWGVSVTIAPELITYSTYSTYVDPIRHIRMHITEFDFVFNSDRFGCENYIQILRVRV